MGNTSCCAKGDPNEVVVTNKGLPKPKKSVPESVMQEPNKGAAVVESKVLVVNEEDDGDRRRNSINKSPTGSSHRSTGPLT